VTVDSNGDLYVTDAGTSRIRKISDPLGTPVVTTVVSSGLTTVADIEAMQIRGVEYLIVATKHAVTGVALPGGQVFTVAGNVTSSGNVNGAGDTARFKLVRGVDSVNGAVFVMDSQNYQVKQITLDPGGNPLNSADWHVALLAGDGTNAFADGAGDVAQFQYSQHLAAAPRGLLYAASYSGDNVREIKSEVSTLPFLGSGGGGATEPVTVTNADGHMPSGDQPASDTLRPFFASSRTIQSLQSLTLDKWSFSIPEGVAAFEFVMSVMSSTETPAVLPANESIGTTVKGSDQVMVTTIAGQRGVYENIEGPLASAKFRGSPILASSDEGSVFGGTSRSVFILRDDRVVAISGSPNLTSSLPTNGTGTEGSPGNIYGIACSADGTKVFTSNAVSDTIVLIYRSSWADPMQPSSWRTVEVAGSGTIGFADGAGHVAEFSNPYGLAYDDGGGWLYAASVTNHAVRRIKFTGSNLELKSHWYVGTLCGDGTATDTDGPFGTVNTPRRVAVGPDGSIYISSTSSDLIRRCLPDGELFTVVGTAGSGFADGDSSTARFSAPYDMAVDDSGYIYVLENGFSSIRRVSPTGYVKTVAGIGSTSVIRDGLGSEAELDSPFGMTLLPDGDLLFGDFYTLRTVQRIID
jgi:hypothetical protein